MTPAEALLDAIQYACRQNDVPPEKAQPILNSIWAALMDTCGAAIFTDILEQAGTDYIENK